MSRELSYIVQGLVLGATAAAQPGPLQAYLLSLTTQFGWRRALPATFAPLISDGPILILVLLVLTTATPYVLHGLQIAGGLFLIYLAYGAFKGFRNETENQPEAGKATHQNLFRGALINLLSPNPYIFWATVAGPILVSGWREAPLNGAGFLIGFYVAIIGGFMAFVALFAFTGGLDPRLNRALSALSAVALLLFGIFHLGRGITQLGGVSLLAHAASRAQPAHLVANWTLASGESVHSGKLPLTGLEKPAPAVPQICHVLRDNGRVPVQATLVAGSSSEALAAASSLTTTSILRRAFPACTESAWFQGHQCMEVCLQRHS